MALRKHTFGDCWSFWQVLGRYSLEFFPSYRSSHIALLPIRIPMFFLHRHCCFKAFSPTPEGQPQSAHKSLASWKLLNVFLFHFDNYIIYFLHQISSLTWPTETGIQRHIQWRSSCSFKASIHSELFSLLTSVSPKPFFFFFPIILNPCNVYWHLKI